MLEAYLPLLLSVLMAVGLGAFVLALGAWLGPRRLTATKLDAFECGNPSSGNARDRFGVKFYLVAMLFLVFDVAAVFVYPWAVVFSDSVKGASSLPPVVAALEMMAFIVVLVVGLAYAWRKGALEWGPEPAIGEVEARSGHH